MNGYVRFVGALLVYLLCLAPFALRAAWFAQRISFSGWAIAMTVVAAVGAERGSRVPAPAAFSVRIAASPEGLGFAQE